MSKNFQDGLNQDFSAKPRVIQNKQKYREEQENKPQRHQYQNLMFEKRVIRGNTYARIFNKENDEQYSDFLNSQSQEAQKIMNQQIIDYQKPDQQKNIEKNGFMFDEEGNVILKDREHVMIETDANVETITDKPPRYEKGCQTEFKIKKQVVRLYMKEKEGEDVQTQIKDGELFDFDYEVQPVLNALCGNVLEISKMEVIQEEELAAMKREQQRLYQLQNKEIAKIKDLEEQEKQRYQQSMMNKKIMLEKKELQMETHKKIIDRQISKKLLRNLSINVINKREQENGFMDDFQFQLNGMFLNWSVEQQQQKYQRHVESQQIVDQVQKEQTEKILEGHKECIQKMIDWQNEMKQQSMEKAQREEQERLLKIEQKKQRKEKRRQARITNEIKNRILAKFEEKQKIFGQPISDIDNQDQNVGYIGIQGGVLGLIIQLYEVIKAAAEDKAIDSKELVVLMATSVLEYVRDEGGVIKIPVQDTLEAQLTDLGTSLDVLAQIEEPEQKQKATDLIVQNVNSKSLNGYRQNEHLKSLLDEMVKALLEQYFIEDQNKLIQFDKVDSANIIEKYNQQGYVKYKPQFYREVTIEDEQPDNVLEEEPQQVLLDFYEQEIDDKVSIGVNVDEDLQVLLNHHIATVTILRELISKICGKYESMGYLNEMERNKEVLKQIEDIQANNVTQLTQSSIVKVDINSY